MIHFNKKAINIFHLIFCFFLILGITSSYVNIGVISVFFSVFLPVFLLIGILFFIVGVFKKKYYFCLSPIIFLFFYESPLQFSKKHNDELNNSISIMSYNVRAFNIDHDIDEKNISKKIINFINSESCDILCLQESTIAESRKIENYPFKFIGYQKNKKKTLLSIHSKYPIINTGYIDFPNTMNNAIYADIMIKKDTIRLYNLHMQSFRVDISSKKKNKFTDFNKRIGLGNTKQIEQAQLVKNAALNSDYKTIICGDFNSTPFSLPYRILKNNLQDSFNYKGNYLGTTYNLIKYPLRLDYFLVNHEIEINSHKNFSLKLSDHEPLQMVFQLKKSLNIKS